MSRSYCARRSPLPHYLRNSRRPWAEREVVQLATLASRNTPTRVIDLKLGGVGRCPERCLGRR